MTIWTCELEDGDGLKYEQIASCIERDIASGKLKPGDRLPPQRKLAKRLLVTIGTVGRGYALAEKRGLVESRVGSGSFVAAPVPEEGQGIGNAFVVDLGINLPPGVSDDSLFEKTISELSRERNLSKFFGALPVDSLIHHRRAAAGWLSRRISCDEQNALICNGTQVALIATLTAMVQPGESVLVESLTFPGIITATQLLKINPIPVQVDSEGIVPDEIRKHAGSAKAIYLNPTNHNPTTSTLSLARRNEIVDIAKKNGLWIIEDDTYGHLLPDAPPTVSSLLPEQSILISSLSKSMAVGLRLALIRVPLSLRETIVSRLQATSFFPSSISVEIASRWMENGTAEQLIEHRREIAERRIQAAKEIFGPDLIVGTPTLNHIWLNLPDTWTANSLCHAANENGVIAMPASVFSPSNQSNVNSIRIALGAARNDEELKVGLSKIARMLGSEFGPPSARF